MTTGHVRAGGGVLWRRDGAGDVEVALVHRPRYDDWSLPKGKAEPAEHVLTCAVREVKEETGYDAVTGYPLGTSRYLAVAGGRPARKTVSWWAMRAVGGHFEASREVDAMAWLAPHEALRTMTGPRGRSALRRFMRVGPDSRTLLLVRSGRASATWTGNDSERPLNREGRDQALTLAALLPAYRPDAITSASPVRCVETVSALAGAMKLPVDIDPALGVVPHGENPSRTLGRICELLQSGSAAVVCTERDVVTDLVSQLTGRRRVPAGRGSTWALTLRQGKLAGVDYWAG